MNGTKFEIPPSVYVLDVDTGYPGKCILGFVETQSAYWLLGATFLRSYISIWDEENDRLGFVVHKFSTATITPNAPLPTAIMYSDSSNN